MSHSEQTGWLIPAFPLLADVEAHLHLNCRGMLRHISERVSGGEWTRISAGAYLDTDILAQYSRWDLDKIIMIARACSAGNRMRAACFAQTSVLMHDIKLLTTPTETWVAQATNPPGVRTYFDEVRWNHKTICPGQALVRQKTPHLVLDRIGELKTPCVNLADSLVHMTMHTDPLESFVAVCMALQEVAGVCGGRKDFERTRIANARADLVNRLDRVRKKNRNTTAAKLLIENSDGGTESVAEAWMLWNLKCCGVQGLITQYRIKHHHGDYFADLAIPQVKLIIEFDGFSKYAPADQGVAQWNEQARRQKFLESLEYVVVRFQWPELKDPEAMMRELVHRLGQVNRALPTASTMFSRTFGIY